MAEDTFTKVKHMGNSSKDLPVMGSSIKLTFPAMNQADSTNGYYSGPLARLRELTEALHKELDRLNKGPFTFEYTPAPNAHH